VTIPVAENMHFAECFGIGLPEVHWQIRLRDGAITHGTALNNFTARQQSRAPKQGHNTSHSVSKRFFPSTVMPAKPPSTCAAQRDAINGNALHLDNAIAHLPT
jgi:hypothetical protein